MVDESTLYFLANIAGWMGSDGYIGLTCIRLSQSNEKLIQSMCKMLNYMFETRTIVYKHKAGANSFDNFDLAFNGSYDIAFAILNIGVLDYHRRSQWLVTMLFQLTKNSSKFDLQDDTKKFLDGNQKHLCVSNFYTSSLDNLVRLFILF
jgi:hypothetical protein